MISNEMSIYKNKCMFELKEQFHSVFDPLWKKYPEEKQQKKRTKLYAKLAKYMKTTPRDVHARVMNIKQLLKAIYIIKNITWN